MPPKALLDTDILSALMRQQPAAVAEAKPYLAAHVQLTFSLITRYEILRGLKAKGATTQLAAFERFCQANEVLPLTENIIMRAADIYADLYKRGQLIGDADILIAATAQEESLILITNNENHLGRVAGLTVENWLKP
ncbi:MAG: type II toxin-antitoxin system VapC family toxin [Abitibacteriaceae bacterium]|nr:type II toxin-antitoxin system VapC family toxin [Abditibacteriaceae bacterium]